MTRPCDYLCRRVMAVQLESDIDHSEPGPDEKRASCIDGVKRPRCPGVGDKAWVAAELGISVPWGARRGRADREHHDVGLDVSTPLETHKKGLGGRRSIDNCDDAFANPREPAKAAGAPRRVVDGVGDIATVDLTRDEGRRTDWAA